MKHLFSGLFAVTLISSSSFSQHIFNNVQQEARVKSSSPIEGLGFFNSQVPKSNIVGSTNATTGTPELKLTFNWLTTTYDTIAKNIFTYDARKRMISDIKQAYINGVFRDTSRTDYLFILGNHTSYCDTAIRYDKDNSGKWILSEKFIYTYQDSTKGLLKNFSGKKAKSNIQVDYFYTKKNFLISSRISTIDSSSGILVIRFDSTAFTIDSTGKSKVDSIFSRTDTTLYSLTKIKSNKYDTTGNLIVALTNYYTLDTTIKLTGKGRDSLVYNINNNETEHISQYWNKFDSVWANNGRISTYYVQDKELQRQLVEYWAGSHWQTTTEYLWVNDITINTENLSSPTTKLNIFPNPASNRTNILFELTSEQTINLAIIDITGKRVVQVANQKMAKGTHIINADLSTLSSGLYFIQLNTGNVQSTQKLMVK